MHVQVGIGCGVVWEKRRRMRGRRRRRRGYTRGKDYAMYKR